MRGVLVWLGALIVLLGLSLDTRGAAEPARKLYVDNTAGDTVSVIDLATRKVIREVPVGRHPHGIGVSPDWRRLYVSVEDTRQVVVIDTTTDQIIASIPTTGRPNQLAVTPDGRFVYIAISDRGTADVIDTAAGKVVQSLEIGRHPHNCYSPAGAKYMYVTSIDDRLVRVFDFNKGHRLVQTVTFDGNVRPLCVTRDEKRLFVALADLHGFAWADLTTGRAVERVERPLPPPEHRSKFAYMNTHGLELTPDSRELWVTSFIGNGLMVFDVSGSRPRYVTTVAVGDAPNWLTFSPDGRFAYSANAGTDTVSIVDISARKAVAEIKVGRVPKRLLEVWVPAGGSVPKETGQVSRPPTGQVEGKGHEPREEKRAVPTANRLSGPRSASKGKTRISLVERRWHLNGAVTYPGTKAEGLLMNVRMVNATFEDRNRTDFEPDANSNRFLAVLPDYLAHGVRAFTLCLQGGMPGYEGALNSAFNPDGSLRDSYLQRVQRVIEACDRQGAAVILGCYYQRQDQVLKDEEAVRAGVVNVANWVRRSGFRNVVLEIANEFNHGGFDHRVLSQPEGQVELIQLARRTAPGLLVSTSGVGDGRLPDNVARASDFLLIHFNGTSVEEIPARITALKKYGKPIVCNEDDKKGEVAARAAQLSVENGASWGLMLNDLNQYVPFTFNGAADDPIVYGKLKELTTTPTK